MKSQKTLPASPPSTPSPVDAAIGHRLIARLVAPLTSVYLLFFLTIVADGIPPSPKLLLQPALALALCVASLVMLRWGSRVSAIFFTWSFWALLVVPVVLGVDGRPTSLTMLPLLIVVCAWLIGARAAVGMALLSELAVLAVALRSPLQDWLVEATLIALAAVLATLMSRQYEQERRKRLTLERHLRLLVENVPTSVCLLDREHRYCDANPRYASFFGKVPADIVGKHVAEVIGEQAFTLARSDFEAARHGHQVHGRRTISDPLGGKRHIIDVDLIPEFPTEADELTNYFVIMREVTEEVEALDEALRSEARFSTLFRASPLATSISRMEDGCFIEVNRAYEEMYGVKREDVVGQSSIREGLWNSPEHRAEWLASLGDGRGRHDFETQLTTPDGQTRDVIITSERIDINGDARMLVLHNDITAHKSAEREVRRLNETLEQQVQERTAALSQALEHLERSQEELVRTEKLAALGSMVAGLAHELNTPIGNAVTLASTLIEQANNFYRDVNEGSALRKSTLLTFAENANSGTGALLRNLERAYDLLRNFKQVAVDQTSEHRRTFLLGKTIREIISTMAPALKHQPVAIEIKIEPEVALDSYPGPLGQVLINLINNAIQHAFDGREHGIITIYNEPLEQAQAVRLTVEDDGAGIPASQIGHIFEPFFTTKLGQGGSGLGLSIIYNIVTGLLGGDIRCQSEYGKGTRFIVILPLCAPSRHGPTLPSA